MSTRLSVRCLLGLTVAVVACAAQEAPTASSARALFLSGEYEQAEAAYRRMLDSEPELGRRGLLQTLLTVGRIERRGRAKPTAGLHDGTQNVESGT